MTDDTTSSTESTAAPSSDPDPDPDLAPDADTTTGVETETLYAIVNTEHPYLSDPLVITNETYETRESAVGSEAALYRDIEIAKGQLAIQRAVFGDSHLRLVQLDATVLAEDIEPAADGSTFADDVGLIPPGEEY